MLEVVLPGRCAACGRAGFPLCGRCGRTTPVVTPPLCDRCGRPTDRPALSCRDCPPAAIHAARAPFLYAGPIARSIRRLKFTGWHALAPALAGAIAASLADDLPRWRPGAVTWVPLARRRAARRGFDQAEVLAVSVGERVGIPVAQLLERVRETGPQARRVAGERRQALAGAFVARPASGTVLLVDDVLTTGATAAACAEALLRVGAERVILATAARSLGGDIPARCR